VLKCHIKSQTKPNQSSEVYALCLVLYVQQ
jgi:hypothetical protein